MNQMKPFIIFDLDGTLADTAEDLVGALNAVLQSQGRCVMDVESVRHCVGKGAPALLEAGFGTEYLGFPDETKASLLAQFVSFYEAHLLDSTGLYPGIVEALENLSANGYEMAVCTSKNTRPAQTILNGLGISKFFMAVCGGDFFPGHKKPDRIHVAGTLIESGCEPGRVGIFVGDSSVDLASARNAGMPSILVTYGYNDLDPESSDATVIVQTPQGIYSAIEGLTLNSIRPDNIFKAVRDVKF